MLRAHKVFLATGYPQSELVGTMKRFLACLALCASLSASAQDDNCTVLGVQELSSLYSELSQSIDTIVTALQGLIEDEVYTNTATFAQPPNAFGYFQCSAACHQLGAGWSMLDLDAAGHHLEAIQGLQIPEYAWLKMGSVISNNTNYAPVIYLGAPIPSTGMWPQTSGEPFCLCYKE